MSRSWNEGIALVALVALVALCAGCAGVRAPGSAPASAAVAPEATSPVAAAYEHALAMMSESQYAQAEQALLAITAQASELPGPWINLGIALARLQRYDEAASALGRALALSPASAQAHNELGIVHRLRGQLDAAEQAYLQAIEHMPDYANAHFNLAVLYDLYLQRPEEALTYYLSYRTLAVEPDARVEHWVADLERRIDQRTAQVLDK